MYVQNFSQHREHNLRISYRLKGKPRLGKKHLLFVAGITRTHKDSQRYNAVNINVTVCDNLT
jgi:hypothetical protein